MTHDLAQVTELLFGRPVRENDFRDILGIGPDIPRFDVKVNTHNNQIHITASGSYLLHYLRIITKDHNGTLVCLNEQFEIDPRKAEQINTDIALKMFATQVFNLKKLGVKKLLTYAAGHYQNPRRNGYYTWPRYGYNAPFPMELKMELLNDLHLSPQEKSELIQQMQAARPQEIITDLPEYLSEAQDMHDLLSTPEGRAWWKIKGSDIEATFDLTDNSEDIKWLKKYMMERSVKVFP